MSDWSGFDEFYWYIHVDGFGHLCREAEDLAKHAGEQVGEHAASLKDKIVSQGSGMHTP